jgi:hypothetical protein
MKSLYVPALLAAVGAAIKITSPPLVGAEHDLQGAGDFNNTMTTDDYTVVHNPPLDDYHWDDYAPMDDYFEPSMDDYMIGECEHWSREGFCPQEGGVVNCQWWEAGDSCTGDYWCDISLTYEDGTWLDLGCQDVDPMFFACEWRWDESNCMDSITVDSVVECKMVEKWDTCSGESLDCWVDITDMNNQWTGGECEKTLEVINNGEWCWDHSEFGNCIYFLEANGVEDFVSCNYDIYEANCQESRCKVSLVTFDGEEIEGDCEELGMEYGLPEPDESTSCPWVHDSGDCLEDWQEDGVGNWLRSCGYWEEVDCTGRSRNC